jgi:P-type Ca2+ transporter type 2C
MSLHGSEHALPVAEVAGALGTDTRRGLDTAEAARRLARDGINELLREESPSPLAIFAAQFKSLVVWVLIGAAAISIALGETIDGAAIIAIVVLNAVIGFFQEFRAQRAIAALAKLTAPRARVVRDGRALVIPAAQIVRGDIVLLEGGDLVGADARLFEASVLRTIEASLTGESAPVEKDIAVCPDETPLADRRNMVFLGTSVAGGSARAIVVATGMATEFGRIASLLAAASGGETPLQHRLDEVARRLLVACAGIVGLVFLLGLLRAMPLTELFFTSVSLAVAAIPEGLPAVVTVALAVGVSRMARRNALIRRLQAVETLGSATVICTDKTGTLTVGEMTARRAVTPNRTYSVTGEGYATKGTIQSDTGILSSSEDPELRTLLETLAGCVDAELDIRGDKPVVVGDPTEGALLVLAAKGGVDRAAIEAKARRIGAVPFDSDRKRMTVVRERDGRPVAFVKGAPEVILSLCSRVQGGAGFEQLSPDSREQILESGAHLAHDALRVLAVAMRPLERYPATAEEIERDLIFLGLIGLQDPPRPEVRDAIARCHRAGIRTVMITGDHPDTARAIALELDLFREGDELRVGADLDRVRDDELGKTVDRIAVYARVTAEHKLRIVRAWKAAGAVVAMTGDGVNDAPALREASIGVAMGLAGTEVTKEAADMVIADDNFASIVAAVEEGRGIYDNIEKTLSYLLAGNAGELIVVLAAVLAGWPLPLLPVQILWINLVTDGLPALALATDPIDPGVLDRPPKSTRAALINRAFLGRFVVVGILTATVSLAAFVWELSTGGNVQTARNAAFSVLVTAELLRSFGARSTTRTVLEVGLFSNLRLVLIVAISVFLQVLIHHVPVLESIFGTEPITVQDCVAWGLLGAIPLTSLELWKLFRRGTLRSR